MNNLEVKEQVENLIQKRINECKDNFNKYIALNPNDTVRKHTHEILLWEYDAILRDVRNLWIPNKNEIAIIRLIEKAKMFVLGTVEINYDEEREAYFVKDYRKGLGASVEIDEKYSNVPILTKEHEKYFDINIQKCCDYCDVYYVE